MITHTGAALAADTRALLRRAGQRGAERDSWLDAAVTARTGRDRPRVVTIGGGTGHYTLLAGLREYAYTVTAVVSMMDSGGSSGILRDEYGILPPGDFTRCLVALSAHPQAMKDLLGHRFAGGSLGGHTVRNFIFTALEEITGDTAETVVRLHEVFAVEGCVLPVTLDRVDLVMHLEDDTVYRGEGSIDGLSAQLTARVLNVYLEPRAAGFAPALAAIHDADLIVIGPGDLYTSLVPNLLVDGVREAIYRSQAKVVFVCNAMTKRNETPGYTVADFVATIDTYLGGPRLDAVLCNDAWPSHQLEHYAASGSHPVRVDSSTRLLRPGLIERRDLLHEGRFIRHDPHKLAVALDDLARCRGWF